MTLDIKVTMTYLGLREGEWKHHAYTASLTFEGQTADFPWGCGTGWHREPEEVFFNRFATTPDYLKEGPTKADQATGRMVYTAAKRQRFYRERDEKLAAGVLSSLASDLEMDDQYSDDELAVDYSLIPSQIAAARAQAASLRKLLGRHVQEFINTYRED